MNVPIFLILGRLTPWAHVSDNPEFPISNGLYPTGASICPEHGSPPLPQPRLILSPELGESQESPSSLLSPLVTPSFRARSQPSQVEAHTAPALRHTHPLFPAPQGHPGTSRKQPMRSSSAIHTSLGTATSAI